MADFKKRRTQYRQTKVNNDTELHETKPPKRKRRGVAVFHKQLKRRSNWVIQYEAGMF